MSINDIATRIFDSTDKANVLMEDTTSANIAFLPSGLSAMHKPLQALAMMKKNWNVDIIENEDDFNVMFEDKLNISVDKKHMKDFVKSVLRNKTGIHAKNMKVNLAPYIKEAMDLELIKLRGQLKSKINNFASFYLVSDVINDITAWKIKFGTIKYLTPPTVLIKYESFYSDLSNFKQLVMDFYGEDRGSLEMLISAFKENRPLNAFSFFNKYDYIFGTRINSSYRDLGFIFEAIISPSWIPMESIYVLDKEFAKVVEKNFSDIKVSDNIIYPLDKRFDRSFFRRLWDDADDFIEQQQSQNKKEGK